MTATSATTTAASAGAGGDPSAPRAAIYTVSDTRFFLGLVALINSLRMHGHDEPIFVADCGLTPNQRDLLAAETTVIATPATVPPYLLKTVLPLRHPADVAVLIDADIIVTRSIRPLIETAATGKAVLVKDKLHDRFNSEWSTLLGLGSMRRQPYANSGFLAAPRSLACDVLTSLERGQRSVDTQRSIMVGAPSPDYAFYFPDQDVLNAILASRLRPEQIALIEHRLGPHPPFEGLTLQDVNTLTCSYSDGESPFLLHQVLRRKPWLTPMRPTPYSQLLPRLWLADDVSVRLDEADVPLRFRSGAVAAVERKRAAAEALLREARGRLGLRRYMRARLGTRQRATLETGSS